LLFRRRVSALLTKKERKKEIGKGETGKKEERKKEGGMSVQREETTAFITE